MPEKVRSKQQLKEIKSIVASFWMVGHSNRRIAEDFNKSKEWVDKYDTISVSSVGDYVREIRRDFEKYLDEDVIEKYTGEFVRKQFTIDEEIEKLRKLQELIDVDSGDVKDKELYLKIEREIHAMTMNQIKMMSDIELVLQVKNFAKKRRLQTDTLKKIPLEEEALNLEDKIKNDRGYKLD